MNLHRAVAASISRVNPSVPARWQASDGYTQAADYRQIPAYKPARWVSAQKQPLTSADLKMLDGIPMNGERAAMYVTANVDGVSRPDVRGGDLIEMPDGSRWLVVQQLENFLETAGWTKVAVTRQT